MTTCYCGSTFLFENCCHPYIKGLAKAPTAEALMRSRYSAYATQNADYLVATTHISTRKFHKKVAILDWSKSNQWIKLEVLASTETRVKFKAYYLDYQLKAQIHEEFSSFVFENGSWFYVDGVYN
ncbi:YchJ family protein [Flavobacterium sp.]|jgi:SEC-C motif-containing protein|uniref:YchJ family protein n=1 Tax=Flavobacterium sp. TaxID=239 RepID=UPI0037BE6973